MMGAALFGAVAVAREFGRGTVVPTFLASPRRGRTVTAQVVAVMIAGTLLSIIGAVLIVSSVALALQLTEYGFLVSAGGVLRVVVASSLTGAAGAALGAGVGALVRNTGGAVTIVVGLLFISPPMLIQLVPEMSDWVPSTLAWSISGVVPEPGVLPAIVAVVVWALVPVLAGLMATLRRDVV